MVPRQLVHRSVSSRCSSFTSGRSPHWTATPHLTAPHRTWQSGGGMGDTRLDCRHAASQISESCMSELFLTCTLILNNRDWDELDTEHQLGLRLRNKLLLLYFGSGSCDDCRAFTRLLRRFWTRLTDPAHVERAAPLALVYVSHDPSADCQRAYMRHSMPMPCRPLRELARRFEVRALPSVVVLQPSGEEVTRAGAEEIRRLGEAAFASWREAAELLDRGFLLAEDFEEVETPFRSLSHHVRRLFYKTEKEKQGPDDFHA
ncbi:nucleoredoxin-like protein 1 [Lampetra fluviatilis]